MCVVLNLLNITLDTSSLTIKMHNPGVHLGLPTQLKTITQYDVDITTYNQPYYMRLPYFIIFVPMLLRIWVQFSIYLTTLTGKRKKFYFMS